MDQKGVLPEGLSHAQILHISPSHHFPTGIITPVDRRQALLQWAKEGDRYIIEDDFESEFSVSTRPMETLFALSDQDNVIYLNTFSKTISPAIRVAYMVLPKKLVAPFEEKLGFYSCTVPTFEQFTLAELIEHGDFERHINRVRRRKRKESD
jgi:GntR family transcriptional regulator/MocR family aminotransferase